jgi:hypothetical protein
MGCGRSYENFSCEFRYLIAFGWSFPQPPVDNSTRCRLVGRGMRPGDERHDGGNGRRRQGRAVPCQLTFAGEGARRPVSRVLSDTPRGAPGRPFLWDAHCCAPRATNPGDGAEAPLHRRFRAMPAAPIRSCSRWGLPCRSCCQGRGALLPHRFTLACDGVPLRGGRRRRFVFCGTFPGVAPAGS